MGKKENPLLEYYDQNERFSELMNGWFFRGAVYWKAESVSSADRRQDGKSTKGRVYRHKYRDLYKRLDNTAVRLFVGTEMQEYVDYTMPLRVMDSDVLSYLQQKKMISSRYKEEKAQLRPDEYLSEFSGDDRLQPVITLILYCGERPWDGATSLKEMLDLSRLPEEMKEYVADYPIHILDVCHTPDERLLEFPSETSFLLLCIKYATDKKAFLHLTEIIGNREISDDTYETIAEYLGEPELLNKGEAKGGRNMCEAIRELVEDGKKEGLQIGIEQGIEQGLGMAKDIFRLQKTGMCPGEIAERLGLAQEQVEEFLNI